jgi:hypothetical protein
MREHANGRVDHQRQSTTRCRNCHKPIIWPGLCYTCATGLPRRLMRVTLPDDGPPHSPRPADELTGPA